MSIEHLVPGRGKSVKSKFEEYLVRTLEGSEYSIIYSRTWFNSSTVMHISRVRSGFLSKNVDVAIFEYNNSGSRKSRDRCRMRYELEARKDSLQSNFRYGAVEIGEMSDMRFIGLIIARALEVNENVAIDILKSFNAASWECKADALIALQNMYVTHMEASNFYGSNANDLVMGVKLRALKAFNTVVEESAHGFYHHPSLPEN